MKVDISHLTEAIEAELEGYKTELQKNINNASKEAATEIVKRAKATAPKDRPKYARSLGYSVEENIASGSETYRVGAKGKQGPLTHLLAYGHAARDGGRVPGNPFLKNAVDSVIPDYISEIEKLIEGGKK